MSSILIVDDEETIRQTISDVLSDHYVCVTAATVEEALEHLQATHYEVVITDISMPGVSGLELLGHIRQTQPDTPVIVMSGISDEEHALGLIKMGAFYYLMKPFNISYVAEMVKQAIKYHRELKVRRVTAAQHEVVATGLGAEAELMVLERQWTEAYRNRNVAMLDRIWAADFALMCSFDTIKHKEQALAMVMNEMTYEYFVTFDTHGNIFGDTAVATGRAMLKGEYKGEDISGEYRYTNTYAKRGGVWQAISSHLTRVEQI